MLLGADLNILEAKANGNISEGTSYSNLFKNCKVVEMRTKLKRAPK